MFSSLALVLVAAVASPSARLDEARSLMDGLQYEKALKVANAALDSATDADRDTLVGLYELTAIASAAVDKPAKAKEAFQRLLSLAPTYVLSKNLPPRTRTPFFEAKTWLEAHQPVGVEVRPVRADGQVEALELEVTDNPLVPVKALVVTLSIDSQDVVHRLDAPPRPARIAVGAASVRWNVRVVGEKGVLLVVTGAAEPLAPPVARVTEAPATPDRGWLRTTGVIVGTTGLAAVAGGVVAGLLSSDARSKVANAERNTLGVVTGLTERDAAALDAQARTLALVANVLFVAGGVLAATGVGLFVFGGESSGAPAVTLQLSPLGGAAVVRF